MKLDVGPQALASRRAGLERKDSDVPPFPMKEKCGHPDVRANVEHAISVAQLNAVLHVAARAEYFAVQEARFIGVQGKHLQIIG